MHERSRTTPRRRGPKHPLPNTRPNTQNIGAQEPPYYTIDNTEDIYGTNILPSQRCYIDPWDLENYDYVRSKLLDPPTPHNDYYENPNPELHDSYLYGTRTQQEPEFEEYAPRMAATMPRRSTRRSSQYQCELDCCSAQAPKQRYNSTYRKASVPVTTNKYDDYMTYKSRQFQANIDDDYEQDDPAADYLEQQQLYNGYGANSSNSSTERHSSIGEDVHYAAYQPYVAPLSTAGTLKRITKSPQIDFPAPPKQPPPPALTRSSPAYDYCQPYAATLPPTYCSMPDCYECISNSRAQNHEISLIYAPPSTYNTMVSPTPMSVYDTGDLYAGATSTLARQRQRVAGMAAAVTSSSASTTKSSSLYGGIYANKFGLSKKGLLQIDYTCSWNDLDRIIGRTY